MPSTPHYLAEVDRFLAVSGSLFCAPLAFVYPALFHLRLCAAAPGAKAVDGGLLVAGVAVMLFTLAQALGL